MTVALTLSIMEGMEYAIFTKLKNVSFPAKLTHIPSGSNHEVENYSNLSKEEIYKKKEEIQSLHADRSGKIHAINQLLKAYSLYESIQNFKKALSCYLQVEKHDKEILL